MNEIRRDAKRWIREVEGFLRIWDPIAVIADLEADGLPPSEYDHYAPHIVGLLQRGGTLSELIAHLRSCRTRAMGLRADDDPDTAIAQQICAWWQQEQNAARSPAV